MNPESEHQRLFDTKETILVINGCLIQAFPSHHLDAMRGHQYGNRVPGRGVIL
jgi:hypothetical protein